MLYTVMEWVYYVCCMVCMVCVGEWTFHWTVKNWKRFAVAGVIYAIGFACNLIQSDSNIPFALLFYVGEIVAWMLICEGGFRNRLFKIMIIFYGVGIVEEGFRVLLELLLVNGAAEEMIHLLEILLTMGCFAIITRQSWYQKLIKYFRVLSRREAILVLWIIVGGIFIIGIGNMMQDVLQESGFIWLFRVTITFELLLVGGIVARLAWESNQKKYYLEQNALKEEMLHTQQEYYQSIYEKDKEMRSFRHDVASQLGLLRILLEKGEIERAKEQLLSVHREFEQASFQKIQVGDEMLDAILSMMKQKAVEKNVRLDIHGKIESTKQYDTYELCTIFSNAIKNAIEACEKMKKEDVVLVKILEKPDTLYCTIENPSTEEMYHRALKQESSKIDTENHGYGVENIRRAVQRLGGEMEYRYNEGKLILEILI